VGEASAIDCTVTVRRRKRRVGGVWRGFSIVGS
jgi:hypothetical protein